MDTCAQKQQRGGWWEDILSKRCSFPIGPLNTWSNFAFIACGWAMFLLVYSDAALVFAMLMTVLGIGSGVYHGFKTVLSDEADEGGMYLVLSGMATYAIMPQLPWIPIAMLVVASSVTGGILAGPNWSQYLDPLTGAFIGVIVLSLLFHGIYLFTLVGLAILALAFTIWHMDRNRTFWIPRAGHALWHVLCALGLSVLFLGLMNI